MKVLLLQTITAHIVDYSQYSIPVNTKWAINNGHDFLLLHEDEFEFHPAWLKIEGLRQVDSRRYDWVWVLDADCIINNPDIKLTDIIGDDQADIIVSENGSNGGRLINSGSIIYRTRVIPTVLKKWEECKAVNSRSLTQHYWDQELINDWYEADKSIFSVRDMDVLNSNWMAMAPGNFIHHYMARNNEEKTQLLREHAIRHARQHLFKTDQIRWI